MEVIFYFSFVQNRLWMLLAMPALIVYSWTEAVADQPHWRIFTYEKARLGNNDTMASSLQDIDEPVTQRVCWAQLSWIQPEGFPARHSIITSQHPIQVRAFCLASLHMTSMPDAGTICQGGVGIEKHTNTQARFGSELEPVKLVAFSVHVGA